MGIITAIISCGFRRYAVMTCVKLILAERNLVFGNKIMVDCTGLEPVTSALSKQRSEPTELTVLYLFAKLLFIIKCLFLIAYYHIKNPRIR